MDENDVCPSRLRSGDRLERSCSCSIATRCSAGRNLLDLVRRVRQWIDGNQICFRHHRPVQDHVVITFDESEWGRSVLSPFAGRMGTTPGKLD